MSKNNYALSVLDYSGEKMYFSGEGSWVPSLRDATIYSLRSELLEDLLDYGPKIDEGIIIPINSENDIDFKTMKIDVIGTIEEIELFDESQFTLLTEIVNPELGKKVSDYENATIAVINKLKEEEIANGEVLPKEELEEDILDKCLNVDDVEIQIGVNLHLPECECGEVCQDDPDNEE
jgi:hypothetical protein